MNHSKPTLSICIPTRNRAQQITKCLESIVSSRIFLNTNEIEIVISDNCSTDATITAISRFRELWPEKIRILKQETDIVDQNFFFVLSQGKGLVCRLINDTAIFTPGAIEKTVAFIHRYRTTRPNLIFANGLLKAPATIGAKDFDTMMARIMHLATWISCLAVWDTQSELLKQFKVNKGNHLDQLRLLGLLAENKKEWVISNEKLFVISQWRGKRGYDFVQVFIEEFEEQLSSLCSSGKILHRTKRNAMRSMMLTHTQQSMAMSVSNIHGFEWRGHIKRLPLKAYGISSLRYNLTFVLYSIYWFTLNKLWRAKQKCTPARK